MFHPPRGGLGPPCPLGKNAYGTKPSLVSPHSITFLPSINYFIVTEPKLDRVGLCQGESFKFECWLWYSFLFSTSILSLSSSCIAFMERNKFHVFDQHVCPIQAVSGTFHGLTEGPNSQILTLAKNKEGLNVIKRFVKTKFWYKYAGIILIQAVREFDNWQKLRLSLLQPEQGVHNWQGAAQNLHSESYYRYADNEGPSGWWTRTV